MYTKIHKRIIISIILTISVFISGLNFCNLTNIECTKIYQDIIITDHLPRLSQKTINESLIKYNQQQLYSFLEEIYLSNPSIKAVYIFSDQELRNSNNHSKSIQTIEQNKNSIIRNSTNIQYIDLLDNQSYSINYCVTRYLLLDSKQPHSLSVISIYHDINLPLSHNILGSNSINIINFTLVWLSIVILITIQKIYFNNIIKKLSIKLNTIGTMYCYMYNTKSRKQYLHSITYQFRQLNIILQKHEKRTIQQLIHEKQKLETFGNLTTDGVIILDQELRFILINKISYQMLPFSKHGINGTYIYNHLPQYLNKQLISVIHYLMTQPCHSNQTNNTKKLRTHLEDNKEQILEFIITKILDIHRSNPTGFGLVIKNVTKDIELNKAKTQFISNVSHELRTPLFNIKSFLETLCDYENSLSHNERQEFLMIANEETTRLTNLINDVLSLSYLDSGIAYQFRQIDIHDIVRPVVQTSKLRLTNKQIDLRFQNSSSNNKVYGYNQLLIQVISNLVDNSLKFTYRGGRVIIKVYNIKNHRSYTNKIRIEIIDDGNGIDIHNQSRIFERFIRVENGIHTLKGTGLGLSIVTKIIKNHNSQVQLYSERFIGSSFWFDLSTIHKKT